MNKLTEKYVSSNYVKWSSIWIFLLSTHLLFAQENINKRALFQVKLDTITDQDIQEPGKDVNTNLDSLLSIWYVQRALQDMPEVVLYEEEDVAASAMPDSIYIRRLNNLPSIISLPYNDIIRRHIVFYIQRIPERLEMILGLSEHYLPEFEQILDLNNIPLEMRALPIIESALNPIAVSRVGATGMWQFMLGTGRQYGLTINSFVDERRDPIASAHAAAKFLNALYRMYGDWTLVLAAYNCGPGNVNKAIKKAGGTRDYWEIYPYLPKETRNYVPAFIAVNYALRYYKEHHLTPKKLNAPAYIDTFMVSRMLHFDQISDVIGIPIDELKNLNPQYKKNIIPGVERPYELRIPLEYTSLFIEKESEIYEYKDSKFFNKNIVVVPSGIEDKRIVATKKVNSTNSNPTTDGRMANDSSSTDNRIKAIHRVQKGESLNLIAQKYGVRLADLQYWNDLSKSKSIHPGQKIIIYTKSKPDSSKNSAKNKPTVHTVKQGETLSGIAQKYDEVSFYDLLKVNGLNKNSKILPGQKLKLP